MTREEEVANYLRSDASLRGLAPGGIYHDARLPNPEGLTSSKLTKVWAGGSFQDTIVVRERAPVPTGDLQSTASKRTSMSQAIEVWAYSSDPAAIKTMLDRVYTLLMGKRLSKAFSATWAGGSPPVPAPELPAGIVTRNEAYRIVSIRTAAAV